VENSLGLSAGPIYVVYECQEAKGSAVGKLASCVRRFGELAGKVDMEGEVSLVPYFV
jgi:hypothetical protein